MKKSERDIYWELASGITSFGLCCFCHYAETDCCGSCECTHPLQAVRNLELDRLDDCWGFKPDYTVPEMADIAGEILAHDWGVIRLDRSPDNMILISGDDL